MRFLPAYRRIASLGLPILVSQLGAILVAFADNIMVGRYTTEALASASFVNNVFNVAVFCIIGFTYGLTPLVGALFTRREFASIGSMTRIAMWMNTLFTLLVMGIMTVVYLNVDRMGQPAELLPTIRPYFRLYLCGLIPVSLYGVLSQWSYGIGRTALPMWITLAANLINICGNWLLIYGNCGCPELGLYGAGLSTLTARIICPLVLFLIFLRAERFRPYRQGFLHGKSGRGCIGRVWRTSFPVSLQLTFESGSFTAAAIMVGWLGAIPLAAFQIIVIVGTLGFCIYYSIASAITICVANAAGTGSSHQMRHVAWAGYHIILVLAFTSSVIFVCAGRQLMHLFTEDAAVLALASTLIFPLVLYQLGDATQIAFSGALRGTSHVMPMLWIAFISYVVCGLPATYILSKPQVLGTYGAILSFSVALFVAGGLFLYYFLRVTRPRGSHDPSVAA